MPDETGKTDTLPVDGDGAPEDAELMRRAGSGDERAYRLLVRRHLAKTVRLAARMLGSDSGAEDVAQEAFVRVWRHAPSWRTEGEAEAKFTTWLYKIVLNLVIDEKRKRTFVAIDAIAEPEDHQRTADRKMEENETAKRVRTAVQELPDRQREAFILSFYQELSNKETADTMGVTLKALESLLVRARKTLREKLEDIKS